MPDLGLGYLAACLMKEGHTVRLCIRPKECAPPALMELVRSERFDLYGIKSASSALGTAREITKAIRAIDHGAIIVMGGPHPSSDPDSVFRVIPEINYAFSGEAEIGLVNLAARLSSGPLDERELDQIPGLIWRKGGETTVNEQKRVMDLDSLPFPAWDLMEPRKFPCTPFNFYSRRYPIAPLVLTRGCPGRCTFCAAGLINGRPIRSRSADNALEEIRLLTSKYGVREIQFYDSNCAHPSGSLRELCERIIAEDVDITWCAPNGIRIDSIDEEYVRLMRRSGCFQVNVGIESGSPRILKEIRKQITPELVREKVGILRKGGIEVIGFFMLGFPGETAAEVRHTVSFARSLPLTGASFAILTPLPGTELYRRVLSMRVMDIETFGSLDFINYRNDLSEVPYDRLRKIQKRAYIRFHLRPRVARYILRNFNSGRKILSMMYKFYLAVLRKGSHGTAEDGERKMETGCGRR